MKALKTLAVISFVLLLILGLYLNCSYAETDETVWLKAEIKAKQIRIKQLEFENETLQWRFDKNMAAKAGLDDANRKIQRESLMKGGAVAELTDQIAKIQARIKEIEKAEKEAEAAEVKKLDEEIVTHKEAEEKKE